MSIQEEPLTVQGNVEIIETNQPAVDKDMYRSYLHVFQTITPFYI